MSDPWYADPYYGQLGDPPHPLNERKRMTPISKDEAKRHAMGRAFNGHLHVMGAFTGADWTIEAVVAMLDEALEVGWIDHLIDHDLLAIKGRQCYYLDVPSPEKLARTE